MIDLSNVNEGEHPSFPRIYQAGQRRVELKVTEGGTFVDELMARWRKAAHQAGPVKGGIRLGLKTGGYHFARPSGHSAATEAHHFLSHLPKLDARRDLRPVLDLEDDRVRPSRSVGAWAVEFLKIVHAETGVVPMLYSYASYVEGCQFQAGITRYPLWLASYGRNDGREHAFKIPRPYKRIAAHQYSSNARVAGVNGRVDISHVFTYRSVDIPKAAT